MLLFFSTVEDIFPINLVQWIDFGGFSIRSPMDWVQMRKFSGLQKLKGGLYWTKSCSSGTVVEQWSVIATDPTSISDRNVFR